MAWGTSQAFWLIWSTSLPSNFAPNSAAAKELQQFNFNLLNGLGYKLGILTNLIHISAQWFCTKLGNNLNVTVIHPLMIRHPHLIHFWLANMSFNTSPKFMKQIVTGSTSSHLPLYKVWTQSKQYWWRCKNFKMDCFSEIADIYSHPSMIHP